jgi:hypothetical protein
MTSWWGRRAEAPEIKGAEINRLAAEVQVVAGGRGVSTGTALTAIATALANEVVTLVQRNPSLTVDEMLDWACGGSVREMARGAANPSADAPKGSLTDHGFAQLTMRIINTATHEASPNDSVVATAKALGTLIAVLAKRPEVTGFDEFVREIQNSVAVFAREARFQLSK